jgi:carboxylesterase type B
MTIRTSLALSAAIAVMLLSQSAAAQDCATDTVTSSAGPVCGVLAATNTGRQAKAFLGIPYAESTAGPKRWTAPVPKARWTNTLAAIRFGAMCPQTAQASLQATPQSIKHKMHVPSAAAKPNAASPAPPPLPPEDEDCLSLNIWTPADAPPDAALPVMAFIHGGAFVAGTSADPLYDGAHLAANHNVILVSFNYRLGALGFLAADGLGGNYGFLDQQAALTWVQKNILAFGGDPAKVTIFGESAGAMSVGLHTFSAPGSAPLFRAAIMESNFLGLPYKPLAAQANVGNLFKQGLNCRDVACLRGSALNDIIVAQNRFTPEMSSVFSGTQYYIPLGPTLDGKVITRQPAAGAASNASRKPVLIGTNKDESILFVEGRTFPPSEYATDVASLFGLAFQKVIAKYPAQANSTNEDVWGRVQTEYFLQCSTRQLATRARAPVYAYLFNHQPSFKVWGQSTCRKDGNVCHGDELPFVFHNADKIGGAFTADEAKLSDAMMRYWTNFATHLDPNGDTTSGTQWPRFRASAKRYLALNVPSVSVANDPYAKDCAFWDRVGYELMNPWGRAVIPPRGRARSPQSAELPRD